MSHETTLAAQSLARVGDVWARVSEAYERSKEPYLLYWRGVLGQCLNQDERAVADLEGFLAGVGDESTYTDLVRDATVRLRRLKRGEERGPSAGVPLGIGLGLAAGAGLSGALAAWQNQVSVDAHDRYKSGELTTAEFPFVQTDSLEAWRRRNGLLALSGGLAAGSIAALITAAVMGQDGVGVAAVPTPGGFVVSMGGRW